MFHVTRACARDDTRYARISSDPYFLASSVAALCKRRKLLFRPVVIDLRYRISTGSVATESACSHRS